MLFGWLWNGGRRRAILTTWIAVMALMFGAMAAPQPAAAQGGQDDVTFWDDPGETSSTARVPAPGDLATEGYTNVVYLNPSGGRTPDTDLLVIISDTGVQVVRDRDWQVYNDGIDRGSFSFILFAANTCWDSDGDCYANSDASLGTLVGNGDWENQTVELLEDGPVTWRAQTVETAYYASQDQTFILTTTYTYTPPSPFIGVEATLGALPAYTGEEVHLYLTADMFLDGSDNGPGAAVEYAGDLLVVQTNETGVGGIAESGRPFDSYYEGYFPCIYSEYSLLDCGNSAEHWSADETAPEAWFGPGVAEPYPMPAIINGRAEGSEEASIDAGVAAHWDISTDRTVSASLFFSSLDYFLNGPDEETPEPAQPQYCTQPATLEIKPDPLEITAGGAATVWVELRNPCRDLPTAPADALLSLSDGLTVIGTSDGVLNLGQRAALQRFSLGAGEMLGWYAIVQAGNPLVTAPLAIAELYAGAAVVRTDSLDFSAPAAPVVVDVPAAPVEVAPAPAEAPAPLPVALPNTAEAPSPLLPAGALAGVLLLSALLLQVRRRG